MTKLFGPKGLGLKGAAKEPTTSFATSAQGTLAGSAVQPSDEFFIGKTSVAHNRGSATLSLAGVDIERASCYS